MSKRKDDGNKTYISEKTAIGIIASAIVIAIFAVMAAIGAYRLMINKIGKPDFYIALLGLGIVGVIWGIIVLALNLRTMQKERREQKREAFLEYVDRVEEETDYEGIYEEVKEFLGTAPRPEGLEEYLADDKGRCVIKAKGNGEPAVYEVYQRYPYDSLAELNADDDRLMLYRYYSDATERKFMAFADDESGHVHFVLDYSSDGEPCVKIFDDEVSETYPLADSFAEFIERLEPKKEN